MSRKQKCVFTQNRCEDNMIINRDRYLNKLIAKKENGQIKVITGLRRCGKSYLLFNIYYNYLRSIGVNDSHIIQLALDDDANLEYRNPLNLGKYVREQIKDEKTYYVFLDEIQKVVTIQNPYVEGAVDTVSFVDVVLGLQRIKNVDLYITGSNSKMLSTDILTEFRGRGDEIRINPLSFAEFYSAYSEDKRNAWCDYYTYGGMPLILVQHTHEDKSKYLKDLFSQTYICDVVERRNINDSEVLEELLNIVSSSIGSFTNPTKLANTFKSVKNMSVATKTIISYLDDLIDAFLLQKSYRYDIKGKKYIDSPLKYYFTDIGLRNARLNFRQQEESHIMENIIYNELLLRGFTVDMGVVEYNYKEDGKSKRSQLEVDFVANKGSQRYYIQSALRIENEEKREQETNSLNRINDSFKKIVIVRDNIVPWHDEQGVLYIGVEEFLLNELAMDL